MADVDRLNQLLNSTSAGAIARALDKNDGKQDNRISSSVWNEFVSDKGGKTISEGGSISVFDAMNSITTYAVRNGKTANKNANDVAEEWLSANQTNADQIAAAADNTQAASSAPANQPQTGSSQATGAAEQATNNVSSDKETKARKMNLRPTYNENFNKNGTYKREFTNEDGSIRSIKYGKDGYPTSMEARRDKKSKYTRRDFAAKKLGLRETYATKNKGIYYDTKTKMHYEWDNKKHEFKCLGKDVKYVSPDGDKYATMPRVKTKKGDNGQVIERIEVLSDKEYTYDKDARLKSKVEQDKNGKIKTKFWRDKNGNLTEYWVYTYDKNDILKTPVKKYKDGHEIQ